MSRGALAVMDSAKHALDSHDEYRLGTDVHVARSEFAELIEACENLQQHPDDLQTQADFCSALARVKGESA